MLRVSQCVRGETMNGSQKSDVLCVVFVRNIDLYGLLDEERCRLAVDDVHA